MGGFFFPFIICTKAEWSQYNVKLEFLSRCLNAVTLAYIPVNSNSLILYLYAESGNFLEKYAINLYLPFCSWYSAEPHAIFEVSETKTMCPLLFGIANTGASVKSFLIISKAFCCNSHQWKGTPFLVR